MDGWQEGRPDDGGAYGQCEDSMDGLDDAKRAPSGKNTQWMVARWRLRLCVVICLPPRTLAHTHRPCTATTFMHHTDILFRLRSNGPHEEHQG